VLLLPLSPSQQIMLKGFNFVGGMPEHLIKRAHLDVRHNMCNVLA
jgi:hypothetical protein